MSEAVETPPVLAPPPAADYNWTPAMDQAVVLVAEDRLTDRKIAVQVGVSKNTLEIWKRRPDFKARVLELRGALRERLKECYLATNEERVLELQRDFERLEQVLRARGERYQEQFAQWEQEQTDEYKAILALIPKGQPTPTPTKKPPEEALTGAVVFELVPTKNGYIERWTPDTGTIGEKRQLSLQIARELGQLQERKQIEVRNTSASDALKRKLIKRPVAASD